MASRLERLLKLIGEENLPAKRDERVEDALPAVHTQPTTISSEADFAEASAPVKWWETTLSLPKPSQQASSIRHTTIPHPLESHKGDPAPLGLSFAPFIAVTKLPYKFVEKQWMQPLATAFFDTGKIWEREWDIYYIWSNDWANPVTFIPEHQLLALVSEIKEAFPDATRSVEASLANAELIIDFDEFRDQPYLRPLWLGRSQSRAQYDSWVSDLKMTTPRDTAAPSACARTLKTFQEKMQLAIELGKNKSKAAKEKRQSENVAKRQNMARSLLRAQQYLGFLPVHGDPQLPSVDASSIAQPLNANDPCIHPFNMDVVFIAFDVEAYEHPPRQITEIGVATLDTRDLWKSAPGEAGENWQQFIRPRHFRIEEYKHLVNHAFVQGCPDKFEFGESEFISKNVVGKVLSTCFKPPFSRTGSSSTNEKRNIVLLGHDISQDITYLQQVGYNVLNSGNIHDKLDTVEMYRVYTRDPSARSLGNIIYDFNFTGWNLHNAGNDAMYTVWAFLAICVKSASALGSADEAQKHKDALEKRMETAVEQAKQKVKDEQEGWEVAS